MLADRTRAHSPFARAIQKDGVPLCLARWRLQRSRTTLQEADALIEKGQYHGAVNRLSSTLELPSLAS
jgi:hypothetical protein